MDRLEREVNVITIINCDECCDEVKDMARRGKAFNHCCCKPSRGMMPAQLADRAADLRDRYG